MGEPHAGASVGTPSEMVSSTESLAQLESTERGSIGVYGNATSARAEMTVTARLSRVSATYPNALALIAPSRRMTFREVHTEANLLARRLEAEFEVGSESLVALLVERSCAMVVGILGIVYAHAAYVPIDLQLPLQRKVEILEDARPKAVLATAETIALLPSSFHHRACLVGDDREALPEESNLCTLPAPISASFCASVEGSLPAPCRLPSSSTSSSSPTDEVPHISPLLYVLYTSGSTGKPKGVMVEHASLVHRIDWLQAVHPLASGRDSVLLKTSAGFGISEWEIFWPLLSGAVMVLASPDGHKDSSYLCDLIRANSVSVLFFVPSMLNALLKEAEEAPPMPSIRYVFCCGEPLKPEICRRLHAPSSGIRARMCNLYGPTEADMTYWYVPDAGTTELVQLGHVPIGHPIEDCDVLLVDPSNESELLPVEGEQVGEICFDSVGTTRGYLGMGDLTGKVVLPSSSGRGRRVFRTGDLGRWGAYGLEYAGRKDCQIKLRGLRIECVPRAPFISRHSARAARDAPCASVLPPIPCIVRAWGRVLHALLSPLHPICNLVVTRSLPGRLRPGRPGEIEHAMLRCEGISEAYVMLVGDNSESQQLVGFAAPRTAPMALIKNELRRALPAYMVPSVIVQLAQLPRNINGKVDRKALAALELPPLGLDRGTSAGQSLAPSTPTELKIAGIWKTILQSQPCSSTIREGSSARGNVEATGSFDSSTKLGQDLEVAGGVEAAATNVFSPAASNGGLLAGALLLSKTADFEELGGNSLLAGRLTSQLRKAFPGLSIEGTAIYRFSTIEKLAAHLEEKTEIPAAERGSKGGAPPPVDSRYQGYRNSGVLPLLWQGVVCLLLFIPYVFSASTLEIFTYRILVGALAREQIVLTFVVSLFVIPIYHLVLLLMIMVLQYLVFPMGLSEGRYPLWGWTHMRWWAVRNAQTVVLTDEFWSFWAGTPVATFAMRLLGMRVGRDVDVGPGMILKGPGWKCAPPPRISRKQQAPAKPRSPSELHAARCPRPAIAPPSPYSCPL